MLFGGNFSGKCTLRTCDLTATRHSLNFHLAYRFKAGEYKCIPKPRHSGIIPSFHQASLVAQSVKSAHQDNARMHVSLMTRQKLLQLGCSSEVLIHLLYNRHCTFGYSLFWSLQNSLYEKIFNSLELHKKHVEHLFAEKDKNFGKMEL